MENKEYTIQEIESKLKEIHPDFTVVPNPNSDLAGIYYQGHFAEISMPKDKVYHSRNEAHIDQYDRVHACYEVLEVKANAFLDRIKDPEYLADIKGEIE